MDAAAVSTEGCETEPQFVFLAIKTPDDSKGKAFRHRAKSHAIRQALLKKRKLQSRNMPPAAADSHRLQELISLCRFQHADRTNTDHLWKSP